MSQKIVLKKGLTIPVKGEAELFVSKAIAPSIVAVCPTDFKGMLPRLLVKEGDAVLCGSPVIADKKHADILLCSPVSGVVKELVRGDKRKLLAVLIESDNEHKCVEFGVRDPKSMEASEISNALLNSGLWPFIVQRPYGTIAAPSVKPEAVFVSAFDLSPLAADYNFCYASELKAIQAGLDAISRMTGVVPHLSVDDKDSAFAQLQSVHLHVVKGKYPASNVGVQINNIRPIQKGQTVWTISLQGLVAIGRLFTTGRLNLRRKVAICGPMAIEPAYIESIPGMPVKELAAFYGSNVDELRLISGNLLTGKNVGINGYLGFFDNQISLIREGCDRELLGWIRPIRFQQFSQDHSYFSWLMPWRKYNMDTNTHGGLRTYMMSDGYYSKYLPMDIFPIYLVKACLAGDIDKMERYGIYEVLPEDLAVCEFVDPSKTDIQDIIAKGIDLMLKEMA